jgi:hypothetical protein
MYYITVPSQRLFLAVGRKTVDEGAATRDQCLKLGLALKSGFRALRTGD